MTMYCSMHDLQQPFYCKPAKCQIAVCSNLRSMYCHTFGAATKHAQHAIHRFSYFCLIRLLVLICVYFRSHEKILIISEILQTIIDDDHIKKDIDKKNKQQLIVRSTQTMSCCKQRFCSTSQYNVAVAFFNTIFYTH